MNHNRSELPYGDDTRRARHTRGDKNRGRRWLFLVVDILLLAVILAAVFFLVVLLTPFNPFGGNDTEQRDVRYTLELIGVDRASLEALRVGDSVTDARTGSVIGEITAVDSRPYSFYTDVPTEYGGKYVVNKETSADKYTVTVTVRVIADYESGVGYTVEDCRIAVGRSYELHFPHYAGNGSCISLTASSEEVSA